MCASATKKKEIAFLKDLIKMQKNLIFSRLQIIEKILRFILKSYHIYKVQTQQEGRVNFITYA